MTDSGTHERARATVERSERVIQNMQMTMTTSHETLERSHSHIMSMESRSGIVQESHDGGTLPPEALTMIDTQEERFSKVMAYHLNQDDDAPHGRHRSHKKGFVPV